MMKKRSILIGKVSAKKAMVVMVSIATTGFMVSCSEDGTETNDEALSISAVDINALEAENVGLLTTPAIDDFDVTSCTDNTGGTITGTVDGGDYAALFDMEGNLISPSVPTYDANGFTDTSGNFTFSEVPNGSYQIISFESSFSIFGDDDVAVSEPLSVDLECPADANSSPVGQNDIATVQVGETVSVDVLANDVDPDGDELTITELVGGSSSFTAEIVDNKIEVTKTTSDGGVIFYNISDGNGGTDQTYLSISGRTVNF